MSNLKFNPVLNPIELRSSGSNRPDAGADYLVGNYRDFYCAAQYADDQLVCQVS